MSGQISKRDFENVLDYITFSTGIILPETNYSVLETFLKERLDFFNITLTEYLKKLPKEINEHIFFIDTITINETYFFREEKHFNILLSYVFPEMKKNAITVKKSPMNLIKKRGNYLFSFAVVSGQNKVYAIEYLQNLG